MKYDIFISYKRRGTSSATAAYLYELLLKKGYNVIFDHKGLKIAYTYEMMGNVLNCKEDYDAAVDTYTKALNPSMSQKQGSISPTLSKKPSTEPGINDFPKRHGV